MFKAMAKLNLGASVVKHRRAGSGAGGSKHGSAGDLSRAFEETTSVSSSPDLADVPRSLEAWAEQDSEDFDAGAFATEHYGDAGERRVARLHAVLNALQEKAGDQMKQNVLDHHSAFVEVAREISRLTDTARALRDLAAVPSDAVDALLADAELGAAEAKRAKTKTKTNDGDVVRSASLASFAEDETRRGPDGVRVSDAAAALKIQAELETLVAQRAPHAALDAAKRAAFFAETLRASAASSRGKAASEGDDEASSPKNEDAAFSKNASSKSDPAAARALLTAAASARRAATAMLAEIAREEEPFDTFDVGVPVSAREPTRAVSRETKNGDEGNANVSSVCVSRRAAAVFVLARTDASGADAARRACVARAVASSRAVRTDAELAERAFSIETLSRGNLPAGYAYSPGGPAFALAACEAFFGAAHALAAELAAADAADGSASSATARLWSATAASVPFARDEADAFADALAARCLSFPDRRETRLDAHNTDATPGAKSDARARRVLAESRIALDAFFAHADALAETAPAFLGAAARRRVCERAALKNCLEKLLFEATAASALGAGAEELLRAYLDGSGDEAADALRAFAVL
jgi:hypothetical protein